MRKTSPWETLEVDGVKHVLFDRAIYFNWTRCGMPFKHTHGKVSYETITCLICLARV